MNSSNISTNGTVTRCYELSGSKFCMGKDEFINSILKEHIFPTTTEWVFVFLHIIVFLVGVLGNFLVCFVVCRSKHMQTVTNLFIVNLAVADFLVFITCEPPTVLQNITETWFLGETLCKIVIFSQTLTVCVSVLTLCCIAVERYYAICRPLSSDITFRKVSITMVVIWIAGSLVALPNLIFMEITKTYEDIDNYLVYNRMSWSYTTDVAYQVFLALANYVVPLILMTIVYSIVSYTLWSAKAPGAENLGRSNSKAIHNSADSQLIARRKVAKMLMAIVGIFFVCYLPLNLLFVARFTTLLGKAQENSKLLPGIFLFSHWLCYFNSAINPVIYNFMSVKFREEFRRVFSCQPPPKSGRLFPSTTWTSSVNSGTHCSDKLIAKSTYRSTKNKAANV
ncbi:orexin receptor type 2-like [Haliotis cracherodii]|uniref:orexin receptor type 2-like n=1 Tax=Haliotis cracherodii TaxID=6455 RepID=UPI0039E7468A